MDTLALNLDNYLVEAKNIVNANIRGEPISLALLGQMSNTLFTDMEKMSEKNKEDLTALLLSIKVTANQSLYSFLILSVTLVLYFIVAWKKINKLERTLTVLNNGSKKVSSVANQILDHSEILSQGASDQASTLED